jgi:hypothetical protein
LLHRGWGRFRGGREWLWRRGNGFHLGRGARRGRRIGLGHALDFLAIFQVVLVAITEIASGGFGRQRLRRRRGRLYGPFTGSCRVDDGSIHRGAVALVVSPSLCPTATATRFSEMQLGWPRRAERDFDDRRGVRERHRGDRRAAAIRGTGEQHAEHDAARGRGETRQREFHACNESPERSEHQRKRQADAAANHQHREPLRLIAAQLLDACFVTRLRLGQVVPQQQVRRGRDGRRGHLRELLLGDHCARRIGKSAPTLRAEQQIDRHRGIRRGVEPEVHVFQFFRTIQLAREVEERGDVGLRRLARRHQAVVKDRHTQHSVSRGIIVRVPELRFDLDRFLGQVLSLLQSTRSATPSRFAPWR